MSVRSRVLPLCPVCAAAGVAFLELNSQPIYQHPVPAGAVVPEPYRLDLCWECCADCGHAWQPSFDPRQLEEIYRSHYYTPAPGGLGVQFRDEFMASLDGLGIAAAPRVLLEIGASDGDTLQLLRERCGARRAYAYEPNHENAAIARQRGLDVHEKFFADIEGDTLEPVDLVYARHVIEHLFDFGAFFAALGRVVAPRAQLLLETPSLDHHAAARSIAPFHVEHVHVFGARSLARLAQRHGWALLGQTITGSGNLISAFVRGAPRPEPERPAVQGLQAALEGEVARLREQYAGRPLLFWGAGSAGIALATQLAREPDFWTDGNPNKVGKHFVGSARTIISPQAAFAAARTLGDAVALVIASSFTTEILRSLSDYDWRGEVYDLSGNRLRDAG